MSVSRKIAHNVIISSLAKIVSTVAALVAIGFVARYLSMEEFGWYVTALTFFSLFNAIGDWGLYQTATREFSRPKADEKAIISNAFGLRIVISSLIVLISPFIIFFLPYTTELKIALVFGLFAYFFYSFYQILIGLFQKRLVMNQVTLTEMAGKIIQVIIIIIGVKLDWGFTLIASTLLINMAINFLIILLLSRRFIKFSPNFDFPKFKSFLKQSWPIGVSVLVTFIYFKADTLMLSFLKPSADVGIYGAAYKIIENLNFFPGLIVGLTTPLMAFYVFSHKKKFISIVNKNLTVFLVLAVPLAIGTIFLAKDIINIVAGPKFPQSVLVLQIVIFSLVFIFFGQLFNAALVSARLQKQLLWALVAAAIFNITANLFLIPKFSYLATAAVSAATELLVALMGLFLIRKYLGFFPKINKWPFIFISGFFMAAYLWIFRNLSLPIEIGPREINLSFIFLLITSPIIYFAGILMFNVITKKEVLEIIRKQQ
ncbi:MAG TPA: flippase [Candidatus Moranbacteria bacterium]|nr:flippase [Candidatus Moranbacteria bacterium]